ncbi:MAG: hypothetical protein JWN39_4033 [Ilumatobacteraceae bacterium]|nr:hypothetical protein [Ilumatobacteraceae bacterium]
MPIEQELEVVARLFPAVLAGTKRSTIRWREAEIKPGLMRYICAEDVGLTTIVWVERVTSMPLADAAAFLGMGAEWPPEIMLQGMREHYPDIHLDEIVQVIEHLTPEESTE